MLLLPKMKSYFCTLKYLPGNFNYLNDERVRKHNVSIPCCSFMIGIGIDKFASESLLCTYLHYKVPVCSITYYIPPKKKEKKGIWE